MLKNHDFKLLKEFELHKNEAVTKLEVNFLIRYQIGEKQKLSISI